MFHKPIQLQLIAQSLNYGLVYWLIARLYEDNHLYAFIFLIAFVALERLLMLVSAIYILLFHKEYKYIPAWVLGNLLGCDIFFGYVNEYQEGLWFESNQFSRQMNYTVHYLNLFSLIICFWVLDFSQQHSSIPISSQSPIYWILIIYGILHVTIVELIIVVKKSQQEFRRTLKAFCEFVYRFVLGIARFGCFCASFAELLQINIWFLWFAPVVLAGEILIRSKIDKCCYFFFLFFQIQLVSSFDAIRLNSRKNSEFYIFNNGFQAVLLTIIFIIRTAFNPNFTTTYDSLKNLSFGIYIPVAISQVYFPFKYLLQGPFDLKLFLKKRGSTLEKQSVNLKLDQQKMITRLREGSNLSVSVAIYFRNIDENIFSKNQQNEFNFEIIKAIARRSSPLEYCHIDGQKQMSFSFFKKTFYFEFNQSQFDEDEAKSVISSIISSQLHASGYQFRLKGSTKSAIYLTQILLNNQTGLYLNPNFINITPLLPGLVVIELFRKFLSFYVANKIISQFIPVNPAACMFDLYEDYLQQQKQIN